MTFYGMDPQEVARISTSLRSQGESLRQAVAAVTALVNQATAVWPGPDSDAFSQRWYNEMRATLENAVDETLERATWLQEQADEQSDVSGVGGESAGRGVPGSPSLDGVTPVGPFDDVFKLNNLAGLALGPVGLLTMLAANRNLTGAYGARYARFLAAVEKGPRRGMFGKDAFRYKQALGHFGFKPNGPLSHLDNSKWLGKAGRFSGMLQVAEDVDKLVNGPKDLNSRISIGAETVADSMKMAKHPLVYAAGVSMSSARVFGEQLAVADLSSEGRDMVWNEIKRDPIGSAQTAGKAIWDGLGDIL